MQLIDPLNQARVEVNAVATYVLIDTGGTNHHGHVQFH